jgi:hypothetical protein
VKNKFPKLTKLHKNEVFKHSYLSKANLAIFSIIFATIGGYLIYSSFAAPVTCDLNATTSTFASQVSAATAGQTICLATGNYGTWGGTNKAITVTSASGATPQMKADFGNSTANLTIDGLTVNGAHFFTTTNVTIKNSTFTDFAWFEGDNTNAVLDSNLFTWNAVYDGGYNSKAFVENTNSGTVNAPSVTIKNTVFRNGDLDGIHAAGSGYIFKDNIIDNLCDRGTNHTDAIQFEGGSNILISGNYIHANNGCELQGITNFDDPTTATIENNTVDIRRPAGIEWYADSGGSIIRHNTLKYYPPPTECNDNGNPCGQIDLSHKDTQPAGRNTQVYDNIVTNVNFNNGSTGTAHNNVSGQTAVYQGGASPTTHDGFLLATTSPVGRNAASDGTDAGIYALGTITPPPPPPDPTPPTVSVTAPTAGTTVSGASVTLSANASDNVGVTGVQFKVDGNNVGSEDTSSPYSISWDSRVATNGSHTITAVARDAAGNSTTSSSVSVTTNNTTSCSTSSTAWANNSFASQTSSFTFDFDATPSATGIDSLTGLSSGAATDFTSLAAAVRFNTTGTIDARNGGAYAALNNLTYTASTSYHFKLSVNVTNHTYSVTVTPAGGSATTIATNYGFRTEQASVANLNNWATNSVAGSQTTCGATLNQSSTGPKQGDINGDNTVNITDLSLLLSSYGQNTTQCITNNAYKCDLSSPADNVVNIFDLSILLSGYGT